MRTAATEPHLISLRKVTANFSEAREYNIRYAMMRNRARALSVLLILLAIALAAALIAMHISTGKAEARVPALRGLALPAAVDRLEATGLKAGAVERSYSAEEPAGHVLAQSPPPGMVVRKPWRVRLTVSLGAAKAPVPRLEGMNRGSALEALRRSGFQTGNVVVFPDSYAPPNTVVAQTPEADATNEESPSISLLVAEAASPADKSSVMPDFVGEPYVAAAEAVRDAGFKLEKTESHIASAGRQLSSSSGTIVAQAPAAGSRIVAGATIRLTVQP